MSLDPSHENEPWYAQGLHFTCTQCGNCCTGPQGYVWFDEAEADQMADYLNLSKAVFLARHSHVAFGKRTLNEHRNVVGEYDCEFLRTDDQGRRTCQIYEVRPSQCRTWPFWHENLKSPQAWQEAAVGCPGMAQGINAQGQFYPLEQIRIIRDKNI